VAQTAGAAFNPQAIDLDVIERMTGDATTAFGAPSIIGTADREPVTAHEAMRLAAIVEAAWTELDGVASKAPESLRKGPRGGGRDTSKVMAHVDEADAAYVSVLGLKHKPDDRPGVLAMRRAVLEILGQPSDGSPIAGREWPPRYAARRIAWHALDHAWEIEDRTDPA
jgi:hypothetical protein